MEEERKQRLRTSSLGRLQVKNERRNSIEELWKRKREKSDVEEQVKDKVAFQKKNAKITFKNRSRNGANSKNVC